MKIGTAQLEKQLDNLRDDFANLFNSAGKLLAGTATDAKDIMVDRGGSAFGMLVKTIKRRPVAAVGVAFGIGYIVMRLTRRR